MTISDKYMFIGPVFNDVTTVGFTHPVVKDRLVEVQLDHVGIAGEVGHCRLLLLLPASGQGPAGGGPAGSCGHCGRGGPCGVMGRIPSAYGSDLSRKVGRRGLEGT